jgi:hypothetical protein
LAESEGTTQGGATAAGAGAKKRRTPRRRTTAKRTSRKKAPGQRAAGSGQKRSSRKRATRTQKDALAGLLGTLQKRAADAGSRLAELSGESAVAAKKAVGTITTSSRRTIQGVKREWSRMDTRTRVKFVAALLGTLAAASGTVVASRRRK